MKEKEKEFNDFFERRRLCNWNEIDLDEIKDLSKKFYLVDDKRKASYYKKKYYEQLKLRKDKQKDGVKVE